MLNCVYRLVAPRTIEPVQTEIELSNGAVLVRPTYLSICNADMRYYLGVRSAEVLAKKLPMALIHEGVGVVVYDPTGRFERGQKVAMVPNNPHEEDPYIAENYLRSSQFCGSGYDGFMQEYVHVSAERLVALPSSVDESVAAFTELVSVAMHAIERFEGVAHARREALGVWGDGNVGYIVSLILRMKYPASRIIVFGKNPYKFNDFTFVDEAHLVSDDVSNIQVDHAFECCGGDGSAAAIDQMIDVIKPEGTMALLGVSENPVAVNTRMVLEKGLRLFGSSRSGRVDFEKTVRMYDEHPETLSYLSALVGDVMEVDSIAAITRAFEADQRKSMGKTVMKWSM